VAAVAAARLDFHLPSFINVLPVREVRGCLPDAYFFSSFIRIVAS
jgi:hypothetical protein